MKLILQRYLAYHLILPFTLSTLFFVSFLLTFQLFRFTKMLINKGIDSSSAILLILHMAQTFIPLAVPLSLFFSMIYCMKKISGDSEFIVMRSFGLSLYQILTPFLFIGALVGSTILALNFNSIPYSRVMFREMITSMTSKGILANIKKEQFYTDIPGVIIYAKEVAHRGKVLRDVFIHMKKEDGPADQDEQVIYAQKGTFTRNTPEGQNFSQLKFNLTEGNIFKNNPRGKTMEKILFQTYEFPIDLSNIRNVGGSRESTRSMKELYHQIQEQKDQTQLNEQEREDYIRVQLEYWDRLGIVLTCISFCILGLGLGVQRGRGNNILQDVMIFVSLLLFYALYFGLMGVARKGTIPPSLAILGPNFVLFIFALFTYRRQQWAS